MFVTVSRCFKLCPESSDIFDLVAFHLVIAITVYKLLHSNIAFS